MSVFKQSEFSIINTNESSEFDIENRLSLRDAKERTLDLRLNYVYASSTMRGLSALTLYQAISKLWRRLQAPDLHSVLDR